MDIKCELRLTKEKGEGLFATQYIVAGEIVMIGIIEEILNENSVHASQIGENTFVRFGGLISKINHSCDPNCGININDAGGHDYIAIRDIDINGELTLDYAMRNYVVEHFPKVCQCNAVSCRGQITGWKDLPSERKSIYKGFVAPYLLELDKKHLTAQ